MIDHIINYINLCIKLINGIELTNHLFYSGDKMHPNFHNGDSINRSNYFSKYFFPDSLSRSIALFVLLFAINLFILPKNNSTCANSGVYWGKYIQVHSFIFRKLLTSAEQWTGELSKSNQILFLSISIVFFS